jgi:hypothetical protein
MKTHKVVRRRGAHIFLDSRLTNDGELTLTQRPPFNPKKIPSVTVSVWRSLRITVFGTYQGASTIMRKAFDWKRSRISVLEVDVIRLRPEGICL